MCTTACSAPPRNYDAIRAYYRYDFTAAREHLREDAEVGDDEQTILDNLRLGMAALADGDAREAERALLRVFDFLGTAGLNEDRTTAAVFVHEGVRIWKGEPFEQALAYAYISSLYATLGDWENMRAAAANSLFRLTDFGEDQKEKNPSPEDLARRAAEDDEYLETGYTAVDTNFALGFLLQAVGSDLSDLAGAERQFEAAVEIEPALSPIVERLRTRDYDTLLIVDYGKGPTKIAYGPDDALVRFERQEPALRRLLVRADGEPVAHFAAVCDVNQMALDHRWNNLEDVRRAKSAIGTALVVGGATAFAIGAESDSTAAQAAGLGAILLGLLTKSGARGDTRYLEFAPSQIFLMPIRLEEPATVSIEVEGEHGIGVTLRDFHPGDADQPRVVYLRLHGPDSPQPHWLAATDLLYTNDHTGPRPGGYPWVLGGDDVSSPSAAVLNAYQESGYLRGWTEYDLEELYRREGILIGSGMENRPGRGKDPSFRHVLEGGIGLFTPVPDSMGYKRLMYSPHPPYRLQSDYAHELVQQLNSDSEINE